MDGRILLAVGRHCWGFFFCLMGFFCVCVKMNFEFFG